MGGGPIPYQFQVSAQVVRSTHAGHWLNQCTKYITDKQVMSGDPIWTFPSVNNSAALYRGTMSSGLHFMNFPTPVALLPSQQLGSGIGSSGGGGGGGFGEVQLGMFGGLNPYRSGGGVSESQASGSHSHHGGDDRHDTTSHHS
ncbi:unnamed protein product [Ilex paraguariensis]|uniref:Uncharacterized protein n=1 Tax=Ilex paraguariensis TaxID=185542 RepID=A0ABC8QZ85_9AQUA